MCVCCCLAPTTFQHLRKSPRKARQKQHLKSEILGRENENALQTVDYESADPAAEDRKMIQTRSKHGLRKWRKVASRLRSGGTFHQSVFWTLFLGSPKRDPKKGPNRVPIWRQSATRIGNPLRFARENPRTHSPPQTPPHILQTKKAATTRTSSTLKALPVIRRPLLRGAI